MSARLALRRVMARLRASVGPDACRDRSSRGTRWFLVALLLTVGLRVDAQVYARQGPDRFPHDKHAKLFPTCTGCHAGATTGEMSAVMPPPALCAECHDGTIRKRVTYAGATPRHDFLRFVHREHAERVATEGRDCTTCHATAPGAPWMSVRRAPPEVCQSCHTHRATAHLATDSRCAACHIAVARSKTLTAEHLSSLPKPPSHAAARFMVNHEVKSDAEVSQCATCHSRDFCARCHVNAADVPAINQLLPDARVAALMRERIPTYFSPDDHRADTWSAAHGRSATANTRRCAACHARPSCDICHTGTSGREVIKRLPDGLSGTPGVQLVLPRRVARVAGVRGPASTVSRTAGHLDVADASRDTTRSVSRPHPIGFERQHAVSAASGRFTCEGCHSQRFCSDCHAGESRRNFHVANFVARHAPESYSRDLECASCHNTEVFCRGCHEGQGISNKGQRSGVYHNGQPLWLLQHGQAARRGLQSCTTCHVQRDCMQCHSQRGWGVNPHGPDFDANRLGKRAKAMCARCHITDPTKGR